MFEALEDISNYQLVVIVVVTIITGLIACIRENRR